MKLKTIIILAILVNSVTLNTFLEHYIITNKKFKNIEKEIEYSRKLDERCKEITFARYMMYETYKKNK